MQIAVDDALRAGAAGLKLARDAAEEKGLGWVVDVSVAALDGAAGCIEAGSGWSAPARAAWSRAVERVIAATPRVDPKDARQFGRGVGAGVSIVRAWCGLV